MSSLFITIFYIIYIYFVSVISALSTFDNGVWNESLEFLCPSSCMNSSTSCDDARCSNCEFTCGGFCLASLQCESWCRKDNCGFNDCADCLFCSEDANLQSKCPIVRYTDVTHQKLPITDSYWYQLKHSGLPYSHESSPVFVDLNNDGVPDFFNSMHAHPIDENKFDRMELGESVPYNFDKDGVLLPDDLIGMNEYRYRSASSRIVINDLRARDMDPHGQNVIDLDGDGILDIIISSGGARGAALSEKRAKALDNLLFWGEEGLDEVTGEKVTIFRGGRDTARKAGVHMRNGRGRINYMLDVNGDGLIDIFNLQDRRASNEITPGVLLINQGNRTWKQDPNMSEYARTMILTDVDGDGLAQELVLNRGFCYPQRDGPGVDPKNPDLGEFPEDLVEFCKSRPVGTTAVYKFNDASQQMEEISRTYSNFGPETDKQPPCCPHGTFTAGNNCHARSIVSGDLDGDLLADHIVLYETKMLFYFSTDSPESSLLYNPSRVGHEIIVPCSAESVRLIDFDNDGTEEILVMCKQQATFLLYTQVGNGREWTLDNGCNSLNAMGALVDESLVSYSEEEMDKVCEKEYDWDKMQEFCEKWKESGEMEKVSTAGLSTVDLNNDGFIDAVVTYDFGYIRFFYNKPSSSSISNEHIVFELIGSGVSSNKYGIGARVILYAKRANGQNFQQFREVSSYQHTTDKFGYKDYRLIFGLGVGSELKRVEVLWANGEVQQKGLGWWKYDLHKDVIQIIQPVPTQQPSNLPSDKPSHRPSEYPSDKPSSHPSVIPTLTPSSSPTSYPSFYPSRKPSQNPSYTPSSPPSRMPSFSPSTNPTFTNSPSLIPTTFSCSESKSDKFGWYFSSAKNKVITRSCSWLSKRLQKQKNSICSKSFYISDFKPAKVICPLTCNICTMTPTPAPTSIPTSLAPSSEAPVKRITHFVWYVDVVNGEDNLVLKDCDWLSRRSSEQQSKLCKRTAIVHGYPSPRILCPNVCENFLSVPTMSPTIRCKESAIQEFIWYVDIDSNGIEFPVIKTCDWLSRRQDENQKAKICANTEQMDQAAKFACPVTCGKCNSEGTNTPQNLCAESKSDKFVWYVDTNENGEDEVIRRNCNWLSMRQDQNQKNRICSKSAHKVCPKTCGLCA